MCGEAVLWAGRTRFVAVSQAGPQPHSLKRFHLHLASSRPHPSSSHSLHLRSDHVPLLFKPFSGSHYPSVMTELLSVAFRALWFGLYWPLWPLLPVLCLLYQVPQGFLSTKLILPPDLAPRVDCLEPRKCKHTDDSQAKSAPARGRRGLRVISVGEEAVQSWGVGWWGRWEMTDRRLLCWASAWLGANAELVCQP